MTLFPQMENGFKPMPGGVALTDKYRPETIEKFVGLDKQKKIIGNFAKKPVSCAWLFVGASGVGKSSMGMALAREMGAELHHIPSQQANLANLEEVVRMCHYVPMFGGFHVVLVDEINDCSRAFQLALFSKLDSTDPCPNTIWVFTCNDTDKLEKPFLSRCRLLEFGSYGLRSDLAEFLAKVWESETGKPGELNFERIAKDSQNNFRSALATLEIELLAL